MIVLSLFDGMACGYEALKTAGIFVEKYYASEIDKYAIQIAKKNHPDIIHLGDVTRWQEWDIQKPDLIIGGSPCQGFSFAGKQLAFDDPRSKLFFEMTDIIRHYDPKFKLLENVKMKKEFLDIITDFMDCGEPHFINSALVSAQNRQRYYWYNWEAPDPVDRGILWGDVRERGVEWSPIYYSDEAMDWIGKHGTRKGKKLKIHDDDEKMQMIEASHFKKYSSQRFFGVIDQPASIIGRRLDGRGKRQDYDKSVPITQCLEVRGNEKTQCITTVKKDNVVSVLPKGRYPGVFTQLEEGTHYRYTTVLECERLQTLPDGYTEFLAIEEYRLYSSQEIDEELSLCNVKFKNVKEKPPHSNTVNSVSCTIRDTSDMVLQSYLQKSLIEKQFVNIVIERLVKKEAEQEGCVIDITKIGSDMATLCIQINLALNLDHEDTKRELVVKTNTASLWKIILEGNSKEQKLFITLIVINLITELKISTFVKTKANIQLYIENLKESQENLLNVELSHLMVQTINSLVSDTQRYKMLGNGWTKDVIAHLFSHIPLSDLERMMQ